MELYLLRPRFLIYLFNKFIYLFIYFILFHFYSMTSLVGSSWEVVGYSRILLEIPITSDLFI